FNGTLEIAAGMLSAKAIIRRPLLIQFATAVMSIVIGLSLIRVLGISAIAIGLSLSMILVSFPFLLRLSLKSLNVTFREYYHKAIRNNLFLYVVVILLASAVSKYLYPKSISMTLAEMAAIYLTSVSAYYLIVLNKDEKRELSRLVGLETILFGDAGQAGEKITVGVNANFHHIAGANLFEGGDDKYKEYRDKWKSWPEKFQVGGFPLFIDVEVTSACNLKCPFCATTFRGDTIKKGFMPFDILARIIDEGKENSLYGVKYNIRGEPLLHPEIHRFVEYAKKGGLVDVYFNTNAMLLDEKAAGRLIEAGLDRISVSFEGYTKDMYEKHRVGAVYETVLANIAGLQSLKKRLGVSHPKVRVQTVMLPDVEPVFGEYTKFWKERADEVAFLDYKEMKVKKRGIKYAWACPQIWQRMAIWWDGTILPCNHDDDALLALGNIRDMTIAEAWHSDKLNALRKKHRGGSAHEIPACDGCYLRDSEILKSMGEKKDI
ncbi:MAG: radical SAM protein, partial [Candidatus Omnitrophica bacterium]|nr:radical SAM protein [Candidatus Omnitrophota bacterium]